MFDPVYVVTQIFAKLNEFFKDVSQCHMYRKVVECPTVIESLK